MKICFFPGNYNEFFNRMADYFYKRGHQIHVICNTKNIIKKNEFTYHYIKELKTRRPISQLIRNFKIRKYVANTIRPDIVSAFYISQSGWQAAFTKFHPFILHVMGSDLFLDYKKNIGKKILNYLTIKSSDVIISESYLIKNITSKIRSKTNNNYVIQFGIRLDLFRPGLDTEKLKKKLDIGDELIIISPRGNRPLYNIDIIIKAFSKVIENKSNILLLVLIQNEIYHQEYIRFAKKYNIEKYIRYFNYVPIEELPYYYNLAKIMVSVPSSDSVPVTLQEAMACGVMPIVSDLPALHEWITNDYNGMIVPARNTEKLADKINYLLDNEEKWDTFIKRNLNLVKKYSDFDHNMAQMEKIYKSY